MGSAILAENIKREGDCNTKEHLNTKEEKKLLAHGKDEKTLVKMLWYHVIISHQIERVFLVN